MIKTIETETLKITQVAEDKIAIDFEKIMPNGRTPSEIILTVDELRELRNVISQLWEANDLYHQTFEAKKDRERDNECRAEGFGLNAKSSRY